MNFSNILELSMQHEIERLHRPLAVLMPDEYRLDTELAGQMETGSYQFPNALQTGTDKRSLTRTQAEFSAKVHVPNTPLYFHRHDFVELLYQYRGECKQYIENLSNCLLLHKGDVFLLNQSVTHGLLQEDPGAVLIKVVIPPGMLSHEFVQYLGGQQGEFWRDDRDYYHYLHYTGCDGDERLFIEHMMTEYYSQNEYKAAAFTSWLQLLIISLERRDGRSCRRRLTNSALELGRVTQYIYEHSESVTLDRLAQKFS